MEITIIKASISHLIEEFKKSKVVSNQCKRNLKEWVIIPDKFKENWFRKGIFGHLQAKLPTDMVMILAQLIRRLRSNNLLLKCYKAIKLPRRINKFWKVFIKFLLY